MMAACEFGEPEPQINADERRLIDLDYPPSPKYEQPQCSDSKSSALRHFEFFYSTARIICLHAHKLIIWQPKQYRFHWTPMRIHLTLYVP